MSLLSTIFSIFLHMLDRIGLAPVPGVITELGSQTQGLVIVWLRRDDKSVGSKHRRVV